ncbi:DUF4405 domain-containing protein [Alterinioella nitratireducens]|uniref:DUF4405 domain-containing protein n=1 Tax=Alterinioella nitratireducens TaxID=2735915 RepID=UPI001556BAF3|nr:DUF4405 domain-containing protein [Alterinioella nitratireducens]NPD21471.1 DUF4405 domain-containing protein [Alterinioella nitratireducens]
MTRVLMRLLLDATALVLLLLAFAYWWLGNFAHEVIGTALFLILARHLLNNRKWWSSLRRGRYHPRRAVGVALTFFLAVAMTVLLATSFAISRTTFAWIPLPDSFALREAHMFAAYWVMVLIGLHIGLNWQRVMMFAGKLGVAGPVWRWGGLAAGAIIALQGLRSAAVMDLWTRLRFDYSLVMWDFNSQAFQFVGHWMAIITLFAFGTHCITRALGMFPRRAAA